MTEVTFRKFLWGTSFSRVKVMSSTLIYQHILEMSNVLFRLLSEISICQLCAHGERYGVLLLLLLMGLLGALAIWRSSTHGLT